jgi:hypothetical protein
MAPWPIAARDLDAAYAAVAQLMPIAAARDALEAQFPLYAPALPPARVSSQARRLLQRMTAHERALRQSGIVFGQARLALRTASTRGEPACDYTGLCLTGCPRFAIWSSTDVVEQLKTRAGFTYYGGRVVNSLTPTNGRILIRVTSRDGVSETIEARRVCVACGPLATARLILQSLRKAAHAAPSTVFPVADARSRR